MRTAMQERFRYPLSHCQEPFWFHEIAGGGRANIAHVAFTARALDTARLADAFTAGGGRPQAPHTPVVRIPGGATRLVARGGAPHPRCRRADPGPGAQTPLPDRAPAAR